MKKQRKHYTPEEKVAILRRSFAGEGADDGDPVEDFKGPYEEFRAAAGARRGLGTGIITQQILADPQHVRIYFDASPTRKVPATAMG
jgi:hypothetical protein